MSELFHNGQLALATGWLPIVFFSPYLSYSSGLFKVLTYTYILSFWTSDNAWMKVWIDAIFSLIGVTLATINKYGRN